MRICLIGTYFSIHVRRWAEWLAGAGHKIDVITPPIVNEISKDIIKTAERLKITLHEIRFISPFIGKMPSRIGERAYYLNQWVYAPRIIKIIKKISPQITHGFSISHGGLYAALSGCKVKTLSIWGSDLLFEYDKYFISKCNGKFILNNMEQIFPVAKHLGEIVENKGVKSEKISPIPMGINPSLFNYSREKEIKNDRETVISTRAFKPVYNLQLLMKAVPHVIKKRDVKFIIVGDGWERAQLMDLVKELDVAKNVDFVGTVDHDRLRGYLASSDIYVSTSLSDGCHISLLEGIACGLFPVVTDIPANREWLVDGRNGYLVPIDDSKILAEKILEALDNPDQRKSANEFNQNMVKERAIWDDNMRSVESVYSKLVAKYHS
jgi:glycosyltransferase involved in cell wall biosynthesis